MRLLFNDRVVAFETKTAKLPTLVHFQFFRNTGFSKKIRFQTLDRFSLSAIDGSEFIDGADFQNLNAAISGFIQSLLLNKKCFQALGF